MDKTMMYKRLVSCIILALMIVTLNMVFTKNVYASAPDITLKKGSVYYSSDLKYKVTKAVTYDEAQNKYIPGEMQIVGVNSQTYKRSRDFIITLYQYYTVNAHETYYITSIKKGAFKNKKKLTRVYSYKEISGEYNPWLNISDGCFQGCTNLVYAEIGRAKYIGKNAFKGCKKLEGLEIMNNNLHTIIKKKAFSGVKKVTIKGYGDYIGASDYKAIAKKLKKAGVKKIIYYYNYRTHVV